MKKLLRKIHLWLSIPCGIFITLICFSGASMVFEKEIAEWCRPDLYHVSEAKDKPLPLDTLLKRVSATLPDSVSITGVTISPEADRAYQVSLSKPRRASIYVDQYTGEVKGRNERLPFFDTMFHLHRWMMGSSSGWGKLLVGICTIALVIILITGLLMWLTNRHKPLKQSLVISFNKGWMRFWHDLHVAGGIYATVFLLALALTGLTWSFSWYRTGFYSLFGVEANEGYAGHGYNGASHHADGGRGSRGGKNHGNRQGERPQHGERQQYEGRQHDGRLHKSNRHQQPQHNQHEVPTSTGTKTAQADKPETADNTGQRHHSHNGGRTWHHRDSTASGMAERHDSTSRRRHHHRAIAAADSSADNNKATPLQASLSPDGRKASRPHRQHRGQPIHATQRHDSVIVAQRDSLPEAGNLSVTDTSPAPFTHWQKVYEQLARTNPHYRQITIADGTAGVVPHGRNSLRATDNYQFDINNGHITDQQPYAWQDKSGKVRSTIYMIHVGSWGGIITRIITMFAALLGATLPLTGYYLWLRKRKRRH